jgi:hypothetical protein
MEFTLCLRNVLKINIFHILSLNSVRNQRRSPATSIIRKISPIQIMCGDCGDWYKFGICRDKNVSPSSSETVTLLLGLLGSEFVWYTQEKSETNIFIHILYLHSNYADINAFCKINPNLRLIAAFFPDFINDFKLHTESRFLQASIKCSIYEHNALLTENRFRLMHSSVAFYLSIPLTELIASRCCPGTVHLRSHKIFFVCMMKGNNLNLSDKTEQRFGTYFSLYRMAGIRILPRKYHTIYMIYATFAFVCVYVSVVAMILHVLHNRDNLQYFVDGIQTAGAGVTSTWTYQFIRYCRSITLK